MLRCRRRRVGALEVGEAVRSLKSVGVAVAVVAQSLMLAAKVVEEEVCQLQLVVAVQLER